MNMTGKKTGSKRQGNSKTGKNLVFQEIVRPRPGGKGHRARPPDGTDYRHYKLSPGEWMMYGGLGTAICGLCAYTFYRSLIIFLALWPLGVLYPLYKREDLKKERLRRLELEFKEGILVLSSFLSAGYSLENGLTMSVKELEILYGEDGLVTREFKTLCAGVKMNRPVEQLVMELGARSGLDDVDNFAQVLAAARRSGGELVEIINYTAGIIRDKVQVKEEIRTMTASRVFEQKIMNGIPFMIVLYIDITSPGFFNVMYGTLLGRTVMSLCLALYAGAVLLSKKILDIEV